MKFTKIFQSENSNNRRNGSSAPLFLSLFVALLVFATTHVGSASAEVPSIVSLGDVNGNSSPEVSVLLKDYKNYAYVMDASEGALINSVLFGDGGTIPTPVSQAVVPDINGNGAPEVAMLGVRPDDGAVVVLINDASTGAWIKTLGFDADFPPVAMAVVPDMNGNGISEIAVLGVNSTNGKVMVLIKDASTNGWIPSLTFDANYPPITMKVVEYASGTVGIAVLGVNPVAGNVKVVVRDVSTRNKIGNAIYFGSNYPPVAMAVVPDINGNSEPEIAVLGVNSTDGKVRVLVRDASSGNKVNAVFFDSSLSSVDMAVVPDINSSGSPEIAVLGVNSTNGQVKVVMKDAFSGNFLPSLGFGNDYPPVGMTVLSDANGSGFPEIAVLVRNSANGRMDVVIKDASTDAKIKSFSLPFADVAAIAAGADHSIALKTDGTVWGWGHAYYNQLGDGTTETCGYRSSHTCSKTPVQVDSLTDVATVLSGTGASHNFAVKTDGTVWAWGENFYGQLGDGTRTSSYVPVQVYAGVEAASSSRWLTGVTEMSAGARHSMAVKTDGTLWAWGGNFYGQLGDGTRTSSRTPVQVSGLTDVTAVGAGYYHSIALKTDGTVWAWGWNYYGQLGNGTRTTSYVPVQVCAEGETYPCSSFLTGVTAIAPGGGHSMAVKTDGTVWAWGDQLGDGTRATSYVPVQVCADGETAPCSSWLTGVTAVAAGYRHSMALKTDGTVWAWGGQLGDGTWTNSSVPVQVCAAGETAPCSNFLTNVAVISGGYYHNMALKTNGTVWAWGENEYGNLGNGTTAPDSTPGVVVESTP